MFFFFFNDYLEEIREAADSTNIKSIINSEEYYFQKALDKYNEFKQLVVEVTIRKLGHLLQKKMPICGMSL